MMKRLGSFICFIIFGWIPLHAQSNADPIKWSGSVRSRVEAWDWFQAEADPTYAFSGSMLKLSVGRSTKDLNWQAELVAPILLGLPEGSIAHSPQGQLGLGATYYAANDRSRNRAMVFLKQGFVEFKNLGGQDNHSLKIGRFEFADGSETRPADATLAAVKRDRLAHRLIGAFNPWIFGYAGRPSGGTRNLATLSDVSASLRINSDVSISAYFAHAFGGSVIENIYPKGDEANYGYVEVTYRF